MTGPQNHDVVTTSGGREANDPRIERMTKVLLVANWLDDLGGVQTATRALAQALRAEGAQVKAVSVFASSDPARRRSATLWGRTPGAAVPRLSRYLSDTRWGRFDRPARARAVRRLEKSARAADAIIAMDVFAGELLGAARTPSARRVFQYHNTFTNIDGTRDLDRVLRFAGHIDAVVALTEHDAAGFRDRLQTPVHAVPNIQAPMSRSGCERQQLVVGVGRYTGAKNFAHLLRAWGELPRARRGEWRLELHGDGPERAMLEQMAPTGATVGRRSDAVPALLARASVLVLPSRYEGLPMVLLEAMAAGVACIATRSGPGVEELLEGDAGWLVEQNDSAGLIAAIDAALHDQVERERRVRLADVRLARFSPSAVTQRWRSVVGDGRASA